MSKLLYLYGFAPADAPAPEGVAGVESGRVQLHRAEGVAAILSEVPEEQYREEELDTRLRDLAWIGERAIAHERVLTWFLDRGAVVPVAPFSLHRDAAVLETRLQAAAGRLRQLLENVAGRKEWGIKLWYDPAAVAGHLGEISSRLRELDAEIATAAPGRRFLLVRKREELQKEELRSAVRTLARDLFTMLEGRSEGALALPTTGDATREGRVLALRGSFWVPESGFAAFQEQVNEAAHRYHPLGFSLEFTGPWPPYHFAKADV